MLHTGKRWFIICPVDEPNAASKDASSEGASQIPLTGALSDHKATVQPAENSSAQLAEHPTCQASTGNFTPKILE